MKTSRLYNILMLLCLALVPCATDAQEQEVIGQEQLGGRKALVGPGCVVNQFATNVQLLSGISGLENLVDEDLDNFATFTTGVAVGVTEQPLFSVKDINNTYAAGTEAGICMVSSQSGGLLSLSVISLFSILVYNDGELVETISDLESGQAGSGVGLDLIKIPGSDNMAVNLTCTPQHDFDELYVVQSGGLDVSVIKELKFKYAFVGAPRQCVMTEKGIKEYGGNDAKVKANASCTVALIPTPTVDADNLVDDDLTNSTSIVSVLSIGYKGAAKLSTDPDEPNCGIKNSSPEPTVTFPAGSELGFVYTNGSALDLGLGNYVEIKVYNTDGTTQTERIEAGVLALGVAKGGRMTSSVVADKEFYAFEIGFYAAVNVNLGTINVHYGFVNEPAMVNHHCPINPSVDSEICDVQSTYQLLSNPALSVQWRLESALDENYNPYKNPGEAVTVTPSGNVTFHDIIPSEGETGEEIIYNGEFTFIATAVSCPHQPQCTDTVVIRRGIVSYDNGCAEPIYNEEGQSKYMLSDKPHDTSGALISISDIDNDEYILDDDFTNYAEYTGGLSIASNIHVIAVKTSDKSNFTISAESDGKKVAKRIGFVVESKSTFLNADVLQFFQIRCYKNGEEVYRQLVDESNAIGVGLIESDQSQKVRFSIEVPADKEFDEFSLWTAGVLKLDISTLRIYYPFIEDNSLDCGDPLKCAEAITAGNGATAYPDMKFQTASIAGVVQNLGNLIDNDPDSYFLYQNTVQAGSGMVVTVKLGKTLDYRHQFGIIMDNETFLASVGLGTWMTVETYYNGQPTGDKFDNWGVLGLDLIGYGDKNYLVNQPTRNFDEVRITFAGIANVLNGYKLYGLFIRGDKNLNGIPDCIDPDQDCAEDLKLSATKVCAGEGNHITLTGEISADAKIYVSAPDQNYKSETVEVTTQNPEFTFDKIPATTAGTGLNMMVYEAGSGRYLDGITYTVYPARAEWRKTPISTDWNEPNNWDGNVNPYCCTDVVIPDGAERYPVLPAPADGETVADNTYCCAGIYFKASPDGDEDNPAQVVNVPELAYHKAWVDVRMMPNRYYMFAAPLRNTYTGDLFVPAEMNGQFTGSEFEDLGDENSKQNRFNPSIYQRMWKTTPEVRLLDNVAYNIKDYSTIQNRTDAWGESKLETPDEAKMVDWSRPFNAMAHVYDKGQGFSVWVDNGDLPADQAVIMRLPKQNTYYNYYTPDGTSLPEHEGNWVDDEVWDGESDASGKLYYFGDYNTGKTALTRANNFRFAYEWQDYNSSDWALADDKYEAKKDKSLTEAGLTITLKTGSGSPSFVCNNPFMSDVDIKTFLQKNSSNVKSLRRYNGDTYETYTLSGEQLVTNVTVSVESEDEDGNVVTGDEEVAVSRKPVIHPLESFFVDAADAGIKLDVVFTRDMMLNTVANETEATRSAGYGLPMMRVMAEAGGLRSGMVLADSTARVNVETMLDGEVKPTVAVFAAVDGKAHDIVSTRAAEIPLGVVMAKADTLTLSFRGEGDWDMDDWELTDQADGSTYSLDEDVVITNAASSVGRFVLRSRSRMAEEMAEGGRSVYITCRGDEATATAAAGFRIERMDVYTVDGVLYGSATAGADGTSCTAKVPQGTVVVIRVTSTDGETETFKTLTSRR